MGYTHYFPATRHATAEEWAEIVAMTKVLLSKLPAHTTSAGGYYADEPLALQYEDDDPRPPEVSASMIRFNGVGDLGHETFLLSPHPEDKWRSPTSEYQFGFEFCKTARKPYDLAVCGVLLLCHKIAPGWRTINSDGYAGDWAEAQAWVSLVLKTPFELPPDITNNMMTKKIRIRMPDNTIWEVPARVIAKDYASWCRHASWCRREDEDGIQETYDKAYAIIMSNDDTLLDWARNNMEWLEVEHEAVRVAPPPENPSMYQDGWVNGDSYVIYDK